MHQTLLKLYYPPKTAARPSSLQLAPRPTSVVDDSQGIDFFTKQARLQIEARMALAQAKDMAHMQMEVIK